MKRYYENWEKIEDVVDAYPTSDLKDEEVLFAYYGDGDYCGAATVLFQRDGKLYENTDSHRSGNRLASWEPDEVTWEQLGMRPRDVFYFEDDTGGCARAALLALIDRHTASA